MMREVEQPGRYKCEKIPFEKPARGWLEHIGECREGIRVQRISMLHTEERKGSVLLSPAPIVCAVGSGISESLEVNSQKIESF